jgi:hypothetical protein
MNLGVKDTALVLKAKRKGTKINDQKQDILLLLVNFMKVQSIQMVQQWLMKLSQ